MALPHIIKHIYNNGTDEVIRRGKKIHQSGFVELIEHDELMSADPFYAHLAQLQFMTTPGQ